MPDYRGTDFKAAVVDRCAPKGVDFSVYLTDSKYEPVRSHDERPVVDEWLRYVLEWLGYEKGGGRDDWEYNDTKAHGRPDYVVQTSPAHSVFVVENKNTLESLGRGDLSQLTDYVQALGVRYGMLYNGRQLIAYEFDRDFVARPLVTLDIESEFVSGAPSLPIPGLAFEDASTLFYQLFSRERFTETSRLVADIAIDEGAWKSQCRPLHSEHEIQNFIDRMGDVLGWLKTAALARLTEAEKAVKASQEELDELKEIWDSTSATFIQALEPLDKVDAESLSRRLEQLGGRLRTLGEDDLTAVGDMVESFGGWGTRRGIFERWRNRAHVLRARSRIHGQELSQARNVTDSFRSWRSEQQLAQLSLEDDELTAEEYAYQIAYVFFVRVLLARILEDKQIIPQRVASDGGFNAWLKLLRDRHTTEDSDVRGEDFVRMLFRTVSEYYRHFFFHRVFDWFIPDDYLLLRVLHHLNRYDFADIGHDVIGLTYERYLERTKRNKKGHFLTPSSLVDLMLDEAGYDGRTIIGDRIIDPACGSGSFLVRASRRLRGALMEAIAEKHEISSESLQSSDSSEARLEFAAEYIDQVQKSLYGLDINRFACYLAELNLYVQLLDDIYVLWNAGKPRHIDRFNIYVTDSLALPESILYADGLGLKLDEDPQREIDAAYDVKARVGDFGDGFDLVIANPPYITSKKHPIVSGARDYPFYDQALSGDTNSYLLFLRLALHLMAENGQLAYVVPITVIGDQSGEAMRRLLTGRGPVAPVHLEAITRFYSETVLFKGVDQAVAILVARRTDDPAPHIRVRGGNDVGEALTNSIRLRRERVVRPAEDAWPYWYEDWLVSADVWSYSVWKTVKENQKTSFLEACGGRFGKTASGNDTDKEDPLNLRQGDVNATYANPFRLGPTAQQGIAVHKGSTVTHLAPLDSDPADWVDPENKIGKSLKSTEKRARETLREIAGLTSPESGFVLKETGKTHMLHRIRGTYFTRDDKKPVVFDHTIWRSLPDGSISERDSQCLFSVITSRVMNYVHALYSTNNHIAKYELQRLRVPTLETLPRRQLARLLRARMKVRRRLQDYVFRFSPKPSDPPVTSAGLVISPSKVLSDQGLRRKSLADLEKAGSLIRGRDSSGNLEDGRVGTLWRNGSLSVAAGEPPKLQEVVEMFIGEYEEARYSKEGKDIEVPDPALADRFLDACAERKSETQRLLRYYWWWEERTDDLVGKWLGLSDRQIKVARRGVPWAHQTPPLWPSDLPYGASGMKTAI